MIAWTAANRRAGRRAFKALWFGQSVSQLGSQVSVVVLPLIAAVTLHASPFEVGLLAALETAPYLLVSLPAGVVADREDRRMLLILTDLARALMLLTIPLGFALNMLSLPVLFLVAVVNGTLSVFFDVAYQSYLPRLVPPERLVEGNQRLELSNATAHVAGPALAGVVLGAVGASLAVMMDAVSFILSALVVARAPRGARPQARPKMPSTLSASLSEGIRLVLADRNLRDLAGSTGTFNLASSAIFAVFVVFATRDLGVHPAAFGLLFGLANVGFIVGAALVGGVSRALGTGPTLFLAAALGTVATIMMPLAAGPLAVAILFGGRFAGAAAAAAFNVNAYSIRQARTPDALQGRVNATFKLLDWGTLPIGALLGGSIATVFGLRAALVVAAGLGIASVLWLARSPVRRLDGVEPAPALQLLPTAVSAAGDPVARPGDAFATADAVGVNRATRG